MEEENILSVDHLGLKKFYFSSKWLLPSVLEQCCWRAHRSRMEPTLFRGAGPQLLAPARGNGAEQKLRSWCRVPATPQQSLSSISRCGASRAFWIPPGPRGKGTCRGLRVSVPVRSSSAPSLFSDTRCGVGRRSLALPLTSGRAGPVTPVPSERRATTSERQATGFVTCFKTHPAWSLLFHYPKSQRNHPAGSISHRQPDSFLVLY